MSDASCCSIEDGVTKTVSFLWDVSMLLRLFLRHGASVREFLALCRIRVYEGMVRSWPPRSKPLESRALRSQMAFPWTCEVGDIVLGTRGAVLLERATKNVEKGLFSVPCLRQIGRNEENRRVRLPWSAYSHGRRCSHGGCGSKLVWEVYGGRQRSRFRGV